MRIKCPNTDILLELPGDRTDMKFTCPACHKVHRVTITISTPGEEPAPARGSANTRTMARNQPAVPKKYATGAYPPVVDIPIDANFVLLDEPSMSVSGVDLGRAAEPPPPFADFSSRKTEIIDKDFAGKTVSEPPRPKSEQPSASMEETAISDEDKAPEPVPADKPPLSASQPEPQSGEQGWHADARAKPRRRTGMYMALLFALGLAGYFGYGEFRSRAAIREARSLLSWADTASGRGEIAAAAASARDADEALDRGEDFYTVGRVYGLLGENTGWFAPPLSPAAPERAAAAAHREREEAFLEYADRFAKAEADDMAALQAEAANEPDRALAGAMEQTVRTGALAYLRRRAGTSSPEASLSLATRIDELLAPGFSNNARAPFRAELAAFSSEQAKRLSDDIRGELSRIGQEANAQQATALPRYRALKARLKGLTHADISRPLPEQGEAQYRDSLWQLSRLDEMVARAENAARAVLSRSEDEPDPAEAIQDKAASDMTPNPAMAEFAVQLIEKASAQAEDLMRLRSEVYGRVQSEVRRGRNYAGTRIAWSMLRMAFDDPEVLVDPAAFHFDTVKARMEFTFRGMPAVMEMGEAEYEKTVRLAIGGYTFTTGWMMLFHKPLVWAASVAESMRAAGVNPSLYPDWELLEGPGAPIALSIPSRETARALAIRSDAALAQSAPAVPAERFVFFENELVPIESMRTNDASRDVVETFLRAARALHDGIMNDGSINQQLRQALKPVLEGTYQKPDPRDYFDSAFCRRLIEANYLETYVVPMPPARERELAAYRDALGKLEAGYDEFSASLPGGRRLFAVARLEMDIGQNGASNDQDPDTGEAIPRFTWRVEQPGKTIFFSPLPARFVYSFMLAEHYEGTVKTRPAGVPDMTEVWHATKGNIAVYRKGEDKARGDASRWNDAIAEDMSGRFDPTTGEPGWNFPLHVIERDDQGDPVTLATLSGIVKMPDFANIENEAGRRRAEDSWLDETAATLSAPGELGLIFHQFFRYCSDSPMPELPNLIGSHYGLSDTHQTVYQSLERRWVGRLIGDCDDLAEFFQVLTRRQGKLSHVMQLPGHAAAGYVEKTDDGRYRFVLLQTGPVMQFVASTLNDAVELAYRAFDREGGISHMTMDAVPLLLRFANEETRTPFVLSARIYDDAEYAEKMIQVQGYWHENVYSAAIEVMEKMVAEDPEIGSIKELGSLYERVGMYDQSLQMRRRELDLVRDNPQASISTLLEIAQLHMQEQDHAKALGALGEMEALMLDWIRKDDAEEFFRAMTFRSFWAMYLSRIDSPARAWELVRYDALMTKRQLGRIADPVLRTLVVMYDRMCMTRDSDKRLTDSEAKAMREMKSELDEAFGRGYFKADDSYNMIIGRYFLLGRYAVSDLGLVDGLARLREDGPYPKGPKNHTRRTPGLTDEDWSWFRIAPQLYLVLGLEKLDKDEYPELYDPEGAKPLLEDVSRAATKGAGLGSDVAGGDDVIKAEMTLAFINNDLDAFRSCLRTVMEKNYSSLYDEVAMTFGLQCGLIPLSDFPAWTEVFREFFPGTQHYFKVVYRALDKENYDHAEIMATASARFFPDHPLLLREAEFVKSVLPGLKRRKQMRMDTSQPQIIRPAA